MVLPVKTSTGQYDILLQEGALQNAGDFLRLDRRVLIVTDSGVPAHYAQRLAAQCETPVIVTVEQGEPSKCMATYEEILRRMVQENFTRSDCVAAVGGGVVGDMAGFAAATYMRGIDFYNLPTTVLSQVDSSIGGKVAIDFCGFKNLVGAFYPPKAVLIDTDTLRTLSPRQIANGLAEAVKMAATCDRELFALFEAGNPPIGRVIEASLRIKRSVVEQDEKETGLRRVLNFGHTLAHAIESENQMQALYHGECVALGMLPMCAKPVRERLVKVLAGLGLPTKMQADPDRIIAACRHDKKCAGNAITVVYVPEIGQYEMRTMPFEEFEKNIREALA